MRTQVPFPTPLPVTTGEDGPALLLDGVTVALSNLDKPYWKPEGYTKRDLLTYYHNVAPWILPYLRDRPLTMKRMPDGADGAFFYAKQAPEHTPGWVSTAPVVSVDTGKRIDYVLAQDTATLLWLANLGCIEMHPWHARTDDIGRPDYAFFDLDPFAAGFATVRAVALLIAEALERLGLRGYPRTSGATGIQVHVPIERVHSAGAVRRWVERVCRLVQRADPERTTLEWAIPARTGKVYLDYGMNTEGRNIAAAYSLRPERGAPVATGLTWDEVAEDVEPQDFTIATIWERLERRGDVHAPVLEAGQDLRAAMDAVGLDPDADDPPRHRVEELPHGGTGGGPGDRLAGYRARRDPARTPEPGVAPTGEPPAAAGRAPRFVVQHHLATRLHHDLRLEHEGVAVSWAVPKGLPDVPGLRHLAIRTEDHPLEYLDFEGDIPADEYGGGPLRIWDHGAYELLEWGDRKVSVRLRGRRHDGEFHLFRTGDAGAEWLVVRTGAPEVPPPPPPELRPMLASDGGSHGFDDPDWTFEVKWDGVRVIATVARPGADQPGWTRLTSRAGNDVTSAYPELAALWERVLARNAVLDAEVVALDEAGRPSFQRLQRRMHVRDRAGLERLRRDVPATLVVFDLLAVDGEPITGLPLSERLERLGEVLAPSLRYRLSEGVPEHGTALFEAAREHGLEGIVAKRLASVYRPGRRSRDWLKLKVRRNVRGVIGGWLPGEGRRSGRLGSLLVGGYADGRLRYLGRVGTGFDEAELERLGGLLTARSADGSPFEDGPAPGRGARWVEPDLVCRVEFTEVTADGLLRAPAYKGLVAGAEPRTCLVDDLLAEAAAVR